MKNEQLADAMYGRAKIQKSKQTNQKQNHRQPNSQRLNNQLVEAKDKFIRNESFSRQNNSNTSGFMMKQIQDFSTGKIRRFSAEINLRGLEDSEFNLVKRSTEFDYVTDDK